MLLNNLQFDGVLPINKPAGMTSHDVVAKLRKLLKTKKIGHTGTLDPEVTGVLPICIGKATKLSDYIMEMPKTYRGQLTLGLSTTTQDFTGESVEDKSVSFISPNEIKKVIKEFVGEIEQVPPMYSSIKINGKKLYELARQGKEIDRPARKVNIYNIDILDINLEKKYPTIDFEVRCSKGTYIRTLCVDIGKKLGYPAHMSKLVRVESGSFKLDNSYTFDDIENHLSSEGLRDILTSMADALPNYPEVFLTLEQINNNIYNGQKIILEESLLSYSGIIKLLNQKNNLVALYEKKTNELIAKPKRVFKEE